MTPNQSCAVERYRLPLRRRLRRTFRALLAWLAGPRV